MNKKLIIGIRFKKIGKIYYFDSNGLDLKFGDNVIVETIRGIELGYIVIINNKNKISLNKNLKPVLRIADYNDIQRELNNKKDEKNAYKIFNEKIKKYKLKMKLLEVEYTFDKSKIIFYFTSDSRIDFRELVKELASIFKTRIELRQVGVRDKAKKLKGYGCCGRKLCCCSFLSDFDAIFIKMAKNQNLSLNPNKISGVCGRLMCCLKYEDSTYTKLKSEFPKELSFVETPKGKGKVVKNHLFSNEITVSFEDGGFSKYSLKEISFEPAGIEDIIITEDEICEVEKEELLDETIDTN